ncbi:MAG: hypothetical protein AAGB14_13580, partial [Verrucomicrobiota bacterium]
MDPSERFIEVATAPLAETNAELHLAAQHELRERIDASDPAALEEAADRLTKSRNPRWITALLIIMGVVSVAILAMGSKHYQAFRLSRQLVNFDGPYNGPETSSNLTREQRLLLYGDTSKTDEAERWKALWENRPDHPPYFVEYAFHYINKRDALPPDFVKTAEEIDSDNGVYLAAAAAIEAEGSLIKGSFSGTKRSSRESRPFTIDDPAKHEASLELIRKAMEKPRFTFYSADLLKERIPLLPARKDFVSQIPRVAYVAGTSAHFFEIHALNQTLAAETQRIGTEGDLEAYREIKDLNLRYFEGIAADGNTLVEALIAKAAIVQGVRSLRDAAGQLGLEDEEEEFRKLDLELKPSEMKRGYQAVEEVDETDRLIEQRGGILHTLSMPVIHKQARNPVAITAEDLTPARRAEHALLGRFGAFVIWAALGLSLTIA